ncbi:zinc transporter foi isoform X1 [Pieris brassicae]|uniref:zinc transporter foi isoform X1 n=1 Tax=Pieris brassicae TaxID=7116 RepID=UPI001E65E8BC|nr:zinc transporter foi isoform X1 [Pieris brassicae]
MRALFRVLSYEMARNIVTVCMFCLLCAAHTCGSHVDVDVAGYEAKRIDNALDIRGKIRQERSRHKRDVMGNYIEQIFRLYGDPNSMTMDLNGFHRMLSGLELEKLINGSVEKIESKNYMYDQRGAKDDVVNCISSSELITTVNTKLKTNNHEHNHDHDHDNHDHDSNITKDTLVAICPILLYQKLANTSLERGGCVSDTNFQTHIEKHESAYSKNMFAVWLYSCLSITAISACGLLGVAVIPIMHKTYYNHLLQFLVALAVGTLCGDALLHLMPHAMSGHDQSHDDGMWKGLAAMFGVVFFYFTEKGLTVVVEWRKRRQKLEEDKLPTRVRVLKDDPIFKEEDTKMCKHKYSEYPYCYDEIDTDTHDEHHLRDLPSPKEKEKEKEKNSVSVVSSNALNDKSEKEEPNAKDWLLKGETGVELNNIKDGTNLKDGDSYTVILREHSRAHHGHSHAHGHVHAPPSSMSSVAWMVIMGDGLHNFTDGMAIGAAFASNLAGGFSTAIAVLCHELPHELGDFAVLLKAGMSVKRAVCYNILSSALCLAGMVCGVLAGHAPSATRWLFAVAAGTFLYIALVDMMPELSTSHSKEGTFCQCLLQLMGLASGIGIMLVIALYEQDLKNLFG